MNKVLQDFIRVDNSCYESFKPYYNRIKNIEFYYSITQMINDRFYYKIIDGVLVFIKASSIMGNYSLIAYTCPLAKENHTREHVLCKLNKVGVGIKLSLLSYQNLNLCEKYTKDPYGFEYIYNAEDYLTMDGGKYKRHRNVIRTFGGDRNFHIKTNMYYDVETVVSNWCTKNKSKHQQKLFNTILKNKKHININCLYYKGVIFGFSAVETLNNKSGVILQRLINPIENTTSVKELNYILHYMDCCTYLGRFLNMGSCCGIKNMSIAKDKLRPILQNEMIRIKSNVKIDKETYREFKEQNNTLI